VRHAAEEWSSHPHFSGVDRTRLIGRLAHFIHKTFPSMLRLPKEQLPAAGRIPLTIRRFLMNPRVLSLRA
jgi:hypothetical protein